MHRRHNRGVALLTVMFIMTLLTTLVVYLVEDEYLAPGGPWTRVDSHCYPGWMVSPFYDSLIAKLIVWAPDRDRAIDRMERALSEFQISGRGVKTTIPFHREILADPRFRSGDVSTDFIEQFMADRGGVAVAST